MIFLDKFERGNEKNRQAAIRRGCKPRWNDHYELWCCTCKDQRHACDQQCSVLRDFK